MSLIYLLIFFSLVFLSLIEFFSEKKLGNKLFYTIVGVMILTAGLAFGISPDWMAYLNAFQQIDTLSWSDVTEFGLYYGMEAGYLYLNKVIGALGFDFGMVTLVVVLISMILKTTTINKYSGFIYLSLLMYMVPTYLFEEHVHIRQGIANAITFYSIRYILDKKLWKFLLCIVIAFQFHESVIVFVLAYWIAKFRVSSLFLAWTVCFAIIGSFVGLNSIIEKIMEFMPFGQDKFEAYESALYTTGDIAVGDIIKILTILAIVLFDKNANHDYYYCVFRNLFMVGVVLYFFLGKGIFGIRLPGYFLVFLCLLVPRMLYVFKGKNALKSLVFTMFCSYSILLFFWFQFKQAHKSNFSQYKTIFDSTSIYGLWK